MFPCCLFPVCPQTDAAELLLVIRAASEHARSEYARHATARAPERYKYSQIFVDDHADQSTVMERHTTYPPDEEWIQGLQDHEVDEPTSATSWLFSRRCLSNCDMYRIFKTFCCYMFLVADVD